MFHHDRFWFSQPKIKILTFKLAKNENQKQKKPQYELCVNETEQPAPE